MGARAFSSWRSGTWCARHCATTWYWFVVRARPMNRSSHSCCDGAPYTPPRPGDASSTSTPVGGVDHRSGCWHPAIKAYAATVASANGRRAALDRVPEAALLLTRACLACGPARSRAQWHCERCGRLASRAHRLAGEHCGGLLSVAHRGLARASGPVRTRNARSLAWVGSLWRDPFEVQASRRSACRYQLQEPCDAARDLGAHLAGNAHMQKTAPVAVTEAGGMRRRSSRASMRR